MTETEETPMTSAANPRIDSVLLEEFNAKIDSKVPRLMADRGFSNPTPLLDVTDALASAAKDEFGMDLSKKRFKVYGKFEAKILGGSVKTRPAVQIIREAISSGALTKGKVVFEATSGNFGMALGLLGELGMKVIVLVSRKLQDGVLEALEKAGVKTIDLDVDICPAPGIAVDLNAAMAKGVAQFVRSKLSGYGLDVSTFDNVREVVEELLARQDVISLAKLLAHAYNGYCPEQYDNELNPLAHKTVTGPEIDYQLNGLGASLSRFDVVCTFGTGGTSTGLSNYIWEKHGRNGVRVVFPLEGQDVAGIRTKEKAAELRFYQPELYLGEHETDFETAKRLIGNFLRRGMDIGESSALALHATLQLINYGAGQRFVVILADGAQKYLQKLQQTAQKKTEVSLEEARSGRPAYDAVIWMHVARTPNEEGIRLLASALGCDSSKIRVAKPEDVLSMLSSNETPNAIKELVPEGAPRLLLVCMVGGSSLMAAKTFSDAGVEAQSLKGGIMGIANSNGKAPEGLFDQGD